MVFRECNPKDSSLWIVVLSEHEMAELARQRIQQPARTTDDAAYTFTASTRSSFSCSAGMPSSSIPGSSLTLVSNFRSLPSRSRRSEEHTSELQSHSDLVCRLLL